MIRIADPKPTPDQLASTGRELDGGLYFYRHRHFDPTVGRWLDREPIGCEADDVAAHRHVGNKPQ
jgi:RHS repeat-associated protein